MKQSSTPAQAEAQVQLARTEAYLASDPGNTDLLARAIDLGMAAGDVVRARQHVQAALARYPEDRFFQYRHGHVLVAEGQWQLAAAVFGALLAQTPDPQLAASLATCQCFLGEHAAVVATLAPYAGAPGMPADAVIALVRALHHLGELDQATALAARERVALAGNASFLAAASLASLDQGDIEQAAALSEAALALGARPVEALVAAGTVALAQSGSAVAIERFNEVLARKPDEGRSWSGLGMATALQGDVAKAIEQLEQAVRCMPGHIGTWHMLGWCKLFVSDLTGAAAAFEQAMALDRNFGESHGALAVVAALRGEREVAEEAIARALRLDRDGLSVRYAQMVLSGEAADPRRLEAAVYKAMGTRPGAFGQSLGDIVRRNLQR